MLTRPMLTYPMLTYPTELHRIALYRIALYQIALYQIALYRIALYQIALCFASESASATQRPQPLPQHVHVCCRAILMIPVLMIAVLMIVILMTFIFSQPTFGQTALNNTPPANWVPAAVQPIESPRIELPRSQQTPAATNESVADAAAVAVDDQLRTGPVVMKSSTRQAPESSQKIGPAEQRIMSDIQEIRAMLGGGLEREFEAINRELQKPVTALGTSPSPSVSVPMTDSGLNPAVSNSALSNPAVSDPRSARPNLLDQSPLHKTQYLPSQRYEDQQQRSGRAVAWQKLEQEHNPTVGEMFSRELGETVRSGSQSLPLRRTAEVQRRSAGESLQPSVRDSMPSLRNHSNKLSSVELRSGHDNRDDPRTTLRRCARALELIAGALEQVEAYQEADTVRQEASQLWEKARRRAGSKPTVVSSATK